MPDDTNPKREQYEMRSTHSYSGWTGGASNPTPIPPYTENLRWKFVDRLWHRQERPYLQTMRYYCARSRSWPEGFVRSTYYDSWGSTLQAELKGTMSVDPVVTESYTRNFPYGDLLTDAQNACFDMAKGASWDFPVFAAELGKTYEAVRNFAIGCDDAAYSFRQFASSPRRAFRTLARGAAKIMKGRRIPDYGTKTMSNLWLQYRYVVNTGILDIKQAAEAASELVSNHKMAERHIRINRTAVIDEGLVSMNPGNTVIAGPGPMYAEMRVSGQVTVAAWMRVKPNFTHSVTWEASKLGLLNPLSTLWELSFLSFVADWVLDLGNYLERLTALSGLTVVDAGYQVTRRGVLVAKPIRTQDHWILTEVSGSPIKSESIVYTRNRWENPTPTWTPNVRMTTFRWLDAAALIRNIPLRRF